MAWNEPGPKRRDPWQKGGGDEPPDLSNALQRFRERFGGLFGGNGSGGIGLIVLAVLAIWFVFDSSRAIDETQRGVVLRFGKFDRIMGSGWNFKWPSPIETVYVVEATRVRASSDHVRMLTKDENIVFVDFNVQYQVTNPREFLFGASDPELTLSEAAESAVRQVVGENPMEVILSNQRTKLAEQATTTLQKLLVDYKTGLVVTELNFQKIRPPQEVQEAFDDATAAREDKQRFENEALAYASKVVPEARGRAARLRAEGQGYRDATVAKATGDSERFKALLAQYKAAPETTRKRLLLETMQQVLSTNTKVLVEGQGQKMFYLPLDKSAPAAVPAPVQAAAAAAPTPTSGSSAGSSRGSDRPDREDRDR